MDVIGGQPDDVGRLLDLKANGDLPAERVFPWVQSKLHFVTSRGYRVRKPELRRLLSRDQIIQKEEKKERQNTLVTLPTQSPFLLETKILILLVKVLHLSNNDL